MKGIADQTRTAQSATEEEWAGNGELRKHARIERKRKGTKLSQRGAHICILRSEPFRPKCVHLNAVAQNSQNHAKAIHTRLF